jgi:hypothetical protein
MEVSKCFFFSMHQRLAASSWPRASAPALPSLARMPPRRHGVLGFRGVRPHPNVMFYVEPTLFLTEEASNSIPDTSLAR